MRVQPQQGLLQLVRQFGLVDAQTAQGALATFSRLVNERNYREMGFDSVGQVQSATLGMPIHAFMVRLDSLRQYQPGQDPTGLLRPIPSVTFPVVAEEQSRSSLTLARRGMTWETVSVGAPNKTRSIDSLRTRLAQQEGQSPEAYFEVRIPALSIQFLGIQRGGQLFLTPLWSDPRFQFVVGTTLPASDAFARMVQAAREHNGQPGIE